MPKYLCLQRGVAASEPLAETPSPAEMQAMYAKFNEWREKFQANIVDVGGRLGNGRLELPATPDGPFIEVKSSSEAT
jgi:hypothetical protein